jgi:ribosome-interacting GTPase 1
LFNAGLRLNQNKPDVVITKKNQGGITVNTTTKLTHLNESVIKAISSEYVINADITIRDDLTEDQLIDVFMGNRIYVPALVIINKKDLLSEREIQSKLGYIKQKGWNVLAISAKDRIGLDNLRKTIFSGLDLIRIYMKPVGKQVDYDEPMILKNGDTIEDACKKLHRDFKRKFRYASVSGPSVKHAVQKVGLEHVLKDGDVLTIVTQK